MRGYVVNLKRSVERREYMRGVLATLPGIDAEFVEAVDGRELKEEERGRLFDARGFEEEYMRPCTAAEVGCTLSHQKCYRKIIGDGLKSAVIFEDDVVVNYPVERVMCEVEKWLDCPEPRMMLLSGWFWHKRSRKFGDSGGRLAEVVDGCLSHAYALNRAAAELMVDDRPRFVADDWRMMRRRGVRIYGLKPHLFDQERDGMQSTINATPPAIRIPSLGRYWRHKWRGWHYRVLQMMGRFESA